MIWNATGLSNVDDIAEKVNKQDILFICKTWNTNTSPYIHSFKSLGFTLFVSPARRSATRGRAKGGIICGLNPNIYKPNNVCIKNEFICIRVNLGEISIIVCVVYFSLNSDLNSMLSELGETVNMYKITFPGETIFIGGDYNCRVGILNQINVYELFNVTNIFNYRLSLNLTINARGKNLINFMKDLDFILLKGRVSEDRPAQFTYVSNIGKSVIDLMWCNVEAISLIDDFKILNNLVTNSDHFPMSLTFYNNRSLRNVKFDNFEKIERLSWKNDNKQIFLNCMRMSNNVAKLDNDINFINKNFTETLTMCSKEAGMYNRPCNKKKTNKPWFNSECLKQNHLLKSQLKSCKDNSFINDADNAKYIVKKKKYKRIINNAKKTFFEFRVNLI